MKEEMGRALRCQKIGCEDSDSCHFKAICYVEYLCLTSKALFS